MALDIKLELNQNLYKQENIEYGNSTTFTVNNEDLSLGENDLNLFVDGDLHEQTKVNKNTAMFEVDIDKIQSTGNVAQNEEVSIFVDVDNVGNEKEEKNIWLDFGSDAEVDTKLIELDAEASQGVELNYTLAQDYESKTHTATVRTEYDSDSMDVEVEKYGFVVTIDEAATTFRVEQDGMLQVTADIINQNYQEDAQAIELIFDGGIVDTAVASLQEDEETTVVLFHNVDVNKPLDTYNTSVKSDQQESEFQVEVMDTITEVDVTFDTNKEGVDITIEGVTETTDSNGDAVFQNLVADSDYTYYAEHPDIINEDGTFTAESAQVIQLDFQPTLVGVEFVLGEEDIDVTVDGTTLTTGTDGSVTFQDLDNTEQYSYSVQSLEYDDFTGTFTAEPDKIINLSGDLVPIWVDVTFDVGYYDATVVIDGEGKVTGADGFVVFEDLDNGENYSYLVMHDELYDVTGSFTAEEDKVITVETKEMTRTVINGIDNLSREPILEKQVAENDTIALNEVPDTEGTIRVYKLEE